MTTAERQAIAALRQRYIAAWSTPWPHDDKYLLELWRECKPKNRRPNRDYYDSCLVLMRENHEMNKE